MMARFFYCQLDVYKLNIKAMSGLIKSLFTNTQNKFRWYDFGLLKTYAFTFGLILASYYPEFFQEYIIVLYAVFGILFLYFIHLLFIKK